MIDVQPVFLWTDLLLFGLIACIVLAAWRARRSEPMRAAWRRVGESTVGMTSLTILVLFLVVGLLDSLHYRPYLAPAKDGKVTADRRPAVDGGAQRPRCPRRTLAFPDREDVFGARWLMCSSPSRPSRRPMAPSSGSFLV
jgi:hypothetical protein